jgi:hypothetical protein
VTKKTGLLFFLFFITITPVFADCCHQTQRQQECNPWQIVMKNKHVLLSEISQTIPPRKSQIN